MNDSTLIHRAYAGQGSVLLAFDFPEPRRQDLAGFAIQYTTPDGHSDWLLNRLTFTDPVTAATTPEQRQSITTSTDKAPIQKFHWVHYPPNVIAGTYTYNTTAMLFKAGSETDIEPGPTATATVDLLDQGHPDFALGFTRGYVSSQAYASRFGNQPLTPSPETIDYPTASFEERYAWLGFRARELVFALLAEVANDPGTTLDVFAYDFNEPDVVRAMAKLGTRLRLFQDDSDTHVTQPGGRVPLEENAKAALIASAGANNVKVGHFSRFQHNKVLIMRRDGKPVKVLAGSANFSVRGLYVQSNNVFVFDDEQVAGLYGQAFDQAWSSPETSAFTEASISESWFTATSESLPSLRVSFSPHRDASLSLSPAADAVTGATSSVLFAIMEIGRGGGPLLDAVRALAARPNLYVFGTTQRLDGSLSVAKAGEASPFIPFSFLKSKVPPPFQAEYSGGPGQVIHHKFVVVDFNGANPVVYAWSSNLAKGGEEANGDNLIEIKAAGVATAYAIEAIGLIDHYRFRAVQQAASDDAPLRLKHRSEDWTADYYNPASPKQHERLLFAYGGAGGP
jgi:hypothetical protein